MRYREKERTKIENIRDAFFKDTGGGYFNNKPRAFVLKSPEKNLWYQIRLDAIKYFKNNSIVWWPGGDMPSGHLLSSQIACVNHLFFLRDDKVAALTFLQNINENFVDVCADFEDGYIGFEVVSIGSYLGEVPEGKKQTRGANCTSVDAMMTGVLLNGKKIQVLIEWKYTEFYNNDCKANGNSGLTRQSRYNSLIQAKDSPIECKIPIENLYYEPFYQIMRQTLLAWQMVKHKKNELQADDWLHIDVVPETNLHLRYHVTAPDMLQSSTEDAWKDLLKEPQKYLMLNQQELLKPFLFNKKYSSLINYLNKRYW